MNLWELNAADFLPLTDPGMAPWLPLMRIDGPPEVVLQQCKDAIEAVSQTGRRSNLLGVTQILGGLRFEDKLLEAFFKVEGHMIESPVLEKWFRQRDAATRQTDILTFLEARFGPVKPELSAAVKLVTDEDRLQEMIRAAGTSSTLDEFRRVVGLNSSASN